MRNLLLLFLLSICIVGADSLRADELLSGGSTAAASAFNPTGSFWNGTSADVVNGSTADNVGNFLRDTGAFALNGNVTMGCSTCGTDYMADGGQMYVNSGNTPDYISNLSFVTQAGGMQVSLLYANSPENSLTSFGIYDAADPADVVLLEPVGVNLNNAIGATYVFGTQFAGSTNQGTYDLSNGSPYSTWGIYVTTCTEAASSQASCQADGDLATYYMGANSQQFALFQSGTNASQYYAGVDETALGTSQPGDYNDLIFGIRTSIAESGPGGSGSGSGTTVPESGTLPMIGFALAGMSLLKRWFAKENRC